MRLSSLARAERRAAILAAATAGGCIFGLLMMSGALGLLAGVGALSAFWLLLVLYLSGVGLTAGQGRQSGLLVEGASGSTTGKKVAAKRWHVVLDALPDPAFVVDSDESVERVNPQAQEAFPVDSVPVRLSAVIRAPEVLDAVRHVLATGDPAEAMFMVMAPQERHWRAFVSPFHTGARPDATGVERALIVFHDETATRRAERERMDFLANASHELRTPLTSLAGFVETLQGHAKDDPAAREKFLDIMGEQTGRMRRLIDDLLSLTRIELNELVPPSGEVPLAKVANDVVDGLAPVAEARGIVLALQASARVRVVGERDELVQVVQNLVDNALKYAEHTVTLSLDFMDDETVAEPHALGHDETPRLTLVAAPEHAAGFCAITVEDDGPGIAREHLPRLGERFFRAAETGVRLPGGQSRDGTGLGLAIVQRIVRRHSGGLTVASKPGEGSQFTVFLPILSTEKSAQGPVSSAPHPQVDPVAQVVLGGRE